jgi:superfamily I DNA/RNA helicase
VLALADDLAGLRRVDLVVNYRCPAMVVRRAVRLVEHNVDRFAKTIESRRDAPGPIILAADAADEPVRIGRLLGGWFPGPADPADPAAPVVPAADPDPEPTRAILTRTNRELLPAIATALDLGLPFRPPPVELLVDSPIVDRCLDEVTADALDLPLLARIEAVRARWAAGPVDPGADPDLPRPADIASAVLAWAVPHRTLEAFREALAARRLAWRELCRDDAPLSFATAHATKGLEFDHVAVLGMERGRFPSARSLADAPDPARALEEERRLAYVAWTRAMRSLTLIYDPAAPSSFLLEAFDADELGIEPETAAD